MNEGLSLSLNVGKTPEGEYWLLLADMDSQNVVPLAMFVDEKAMDTFCLFMETQGYLSIKLPSQRDIDDLLS